MAHRDFDQIEVSGTPKLRETKDMFKTSTLQGKKKKWCIGISVTVGLVALGGMIAGIVIATRSPLSSPVECVDASCALSPDEQPITTDCFEDTKACSTDKCECDEVDKGCCVPLFETVPANCADVSFSRVTRCMCRPCAEQKIAVSGRIKNICDSCIVVIARNGQEVGRSTSQGDFNFVADRPSGDRIVLTLVDTKNAYFQQVKTVLLGEGRQVYPNVDVVMTVKPDVTTIINAAVGGRAHPNNDTSSTFSLDFPADSIRASNGTIYNGEVTVRLDFVDPGNVTEVDRIPGQLLVDLPETNETGFLSSSGMFQIDLTAEDGSQLEASNVTILLDAGNLGVNETEATELWELSEETGKWKSVAPVKNYVSGRGIARMRTARNLNLIAITLANLRPRRIWNCDALLWRYCYLKVRVFRSETVSYENQINGVTISTLYLRAGNKTSVTWANYLNSYSSGNGACLIVPCDGFDRTSVSSVIIQAPGYHPYNPRVTPEVRKSVGYKEYADGFEIKIPTEGLPNISYNGPFHSSAGWYNSCNRDRYDINNENFFVFRKNQGPPTTASIVNENSTAANSSVTTTSLTNGQNETRTTQSTVNITRTQASGVLDNSTTAVLSTVSRSESTPVIFTTTGLGGDATATSETATTQRTADETTTTVTTTTIDSPGLTNTTTAAVLSTTPDSESISTVSTSTLIGSDATSASKATGTGSITQTTTISNTSQTATQAPVLTNYSTTAALPTTPGSETTSTISTTKSLGGDGTVASEASTTKSIVKESTTADSVTAITTDNGSTSSTNEMDVTVVDPAVNETTTTTDPMNTSIISTTSSTPMVEPSSKMSSNGLSSTISDVGGDATTANEVGTSQSITEEPTTGDAANATTITSTTATALSISITPTITAEVEPTAEGTFTALSTTKGDAAVATEASSTQSIVTEQTTTVKSINGNTSVNSTTATTSSPYFSVVDPLVTVTAPNTSGPTKTSSDTTAVATVSTTSIVDDTGKNGTAANEVTTNATVNINVETHASANSSYVTDTALNYTGTETTTDDNFDSIENPTTIPPV